MTQVALPFRPIAGDPEDISQVMADFDAILTVLNGDIRNDNIATLAAIAVAKLAAGSNGDRLEMVGGVPTWIKTARARAHRSSVTLAHAAHTAIPFDVEDADTDSIVDVAGGTPSRFVIKTAGTYMVSGSVFFPPGTAGPRYAYLRKQGTTALNGIEVPAVASPDNTVLSPNDIVSMAVNEYLELIGYQVSGGGSLAGCSANLSVYRMGA